MKTYSRMLLLAIVLCLILFATGCKSIKEMVAEFIEEKIDEQVNTENDPDARYITGSYDVPWVLTDYDCLPEQVGEEGVSRVQIAVYNDYRNATIMVDGWLFVYNAVVDETTVRGTATGLNYADDVCVHDYAAEVEFTVDIDTEEVTGYIEVDYVASASCPEGGDSTCGYTKEFGF